jgi:hypothetical protein
VALAATAALAGVVPAQASAAPFELGHIPECTELVPAAISVDSTPVTLDVRVLLDGTSLARAQAVMAEAARSYAPLGITLAPTYEGVSFSGTDAGGLIDQARARYGGERPAGVDVVYTFTSKDITASPFGSGVAGLADCIGGVAFADSAFAVGEDLADSPQSILVIRRGVQTAARIAAHEIGHLMGAHHHYANCVENLQAALTDDNLCTLMFNEVSFTGRSFSTLNALVVRGHAQLYATP